MPREKASKPKPRRGLSLDRLLPATRHSLPHSATVDAPPPARRPRRPDRPPLRRSIRLDDNQTATEERRRIFIHGPRQSSFDEGDAYDDDDEHECDCVRSSLEHSRGPSAETPDDECDDDEPELVNPLTRESGLANDVHPYRAHSRGVSSDRVLGNDRRHDISKSPASKAPTRALSQGIFERRLPKIYKFGLMDKCKRASSSALYERRERSPSEEFYNETGSMRLSSQELFEKFCSEDFRSLYGREDDKRRRTPHSKSTGSSGSDVRHEKACCRRVGPCNSQPTLGTRRHVCLTRMPHSDRSTDSEGQTSPKTGRPCPTTLRPLPLNYTDDDEENVNKGNDYSRSAPLLSPDRYEAHFTFDISEHSEATSIRDETPSDATETRNLTLYEEPHSDRTSICEFYDAVFSTHRPSLRRDSSRKRGPFDLSALDFRAIDDESPRISRRPSQRSTDETIRQNSESQSWASDSVFNTPLRRARELSPSSVDTRQSAPPVSDYLRADSAAASSTAADSTAADTTVIEDEPTSVIERNEYTLALKLGRIELSDSEEYVPTPVTPIAAEGTRMSSRLSMHRLEPFEPVRTNPGAESEANSVKEIKTDTKRSRRGASEPRRSSRCFPL